MYILLIVFLKSPRNYNVSSNFQNFLFDFNYPSICDFSFILFLFGCPKLLSVAVSLFFWQFPVLYISTITMLDWKVNYWPSKNYFSFTYQLDAYSLTRFVGRDRKNCYERMWKTFSSIFLWPWLIKLARLEKEMILMLHAVYCW